MPLPRSNKYHAEPCEIDGVRFASKAEGRRYRILQTLARAGAIADLRLQVRFPLVVNGHPIGRYTADFVYTDLATGQTVVEDVKGAASRDYILRKKLMKALHGIDIQEIRP